MLLLLVLMSISIGVWREGKGGPCSPGFWNFYKERCFLSFEWEKTNFTTFEPPLKKFWKHPLAPLPPLEKSFRRPCLWAESYETANLSLFCSGCCAYSDDGFHLYSWHYTQNLAFLHTSQTASMRSEVSWPIKKVSTHLLPTLCRRVPAIPNLDGCRSQFADARSDNLWYNRGRVRLKWTGIRFQS